MTIDELLIDKLKLEVLDYYCNKDISEARNIHPDELSLEKMKVLINNNVEFIPHTTYIVVRMKDDI